jgi:hypothetical protein
MENHFENKNQGRGSLPSQRPFRAMGVADNLRKRRLEGGIRKERSYDKLSSK